VHVRQAVAALFVLASVGQAARAQSRTSAVYGIAYDSLRAATLESAFIMVAGQSVSATSDSRGRFRLDGLLPGNYTFVVHHGYATSKKERRSGSASSWIRYASNATPIFARPCRRLQCFGVACLGSSSTVSGSIGEMSPPN
jgi:hypothetical protein